MTTKYTVKSIRAEDGMPASPEVEIPRKEYKTLLRLYNRPVSRGGKLRGVEFRIDTTYRGHVATKRLSLMVPTQFCGDDLPELDNTVL